MRRRLSRLQPIEDSTPRISRGRRQARSYQVRMRPYSQGSSSPSATSVTISRASRTAESTASRALRRWTGGRTSALTPTPTAVPRRAARTRETAESSVASPGTRVNRAAVEA
ncbi:hypothetical protein [Streptomyces radiopugnans]|uniref:hypothetical protein n=1 Tax=Streptomyces radiopugnans TaxID=403935 RepID=UPI003F1BFAFC